MKRISILGSTGSIGTQCLDVISGNRDRFSVAALSCSKSIELLCRQIEEFSPAAVCVAEEADAAELSKKYSGIEFFHGDEGLRAIAAMEDCDMVVNSLMGMRGLEPTMAAIEAGKDIAFANKETLVVGGQLVMDAVKRRGVKLLPVDSEHSAVFQCIQGIQCGTAKKRDAGAGSGASELVHGKEDNGGFGHDDEQRPRGDRGKVAVRYTCRKDTDRRAPAEHTAFCCRILRRQRDRADGTAGHESAYRVRALIS